MLMGIHWGYSEDTMWYRMVFFVANNMIFDTFGYIWGYPATGYTPSDCNFTWEQWKHDNSPVDYPVDYPVDLQ